MDVIAYPKPSHIIDKRDPGTTIKLLRQSSLEMLLRVVFSVIVPIDNISSCRQHTSGLLQVKDQGLRKVFAKAPLCGPLGYIYFKSKFDTIDENFSVGELHITKNK